MPLRDPLSCLLREARPLLAVHALLLVATLLIGPGNLADVRVQGCWLLWLSPGWFLAPLWCGSHATPLRRYLAAAVTALALHAWLMVLAQGLGFGIPVYTMLWGLLIAGSLVARATALGRGEINPKATRIPRRQVWVAVVWIVFAVAVFRTPRSNDIHQFLLQQQEMLATRSLDVPTIGLASMGIDEPMPRWRANYWHALPCILAWNSDMAVDQVLLRYATIPVALTLLLCWTEIIRSLAGGGRSMAYPSVMLASVAPVLIAYRNFNAFNYSFRFTNNFLLDKDAALFFLYPATLWLCERWVRGRDRYLLPLLALSPALVRFHPLTPVYVILGLTVMALGWWGGRRVSVRRAVAAAALAVFWFAIVLQLGDAQSYHREIQAILATDYRQSLEGSPLHYWAGFYSAVPGHDLAVDTTVGGQPGRLRLRAGLLLGCGLLALAHGAVLVLLLSRGIDRGSAPMTRLRILGSATLGVLWLLVLASPSLLSRFPHYTAGFERLHWFAYPFAVMAITGAFALVPRRLRRFLGPAVLIGVTMFATAYRAGVASPNSHLRFVNNLLDTELEANRARRERWRSIDPARTLEALRPRALSDSDRVLLLSRQATRHFWLTRQGVFWPDPYIEAFVWSRRGDDFLNDRLHFYRMLDRQSAAGAPAWLGEQGVDLIVDPRPGGDAFLSGFFEASGLDARRVGPGQWRISPPGVAAGP